ncbi:hypothetical protein AYO45_03110 [Gammaproteobacteria bacterium SCGC AG-212-F23]|nr:hypothetical protein AYO45_03110 [Gammaproteobacteria bacterium SCGC AG-212-F23]
MSASNQVAAVADPIIRLQILSGILQAIRKDIESKRVSPVFGRIEDIRDVKTADVKTNTHQYKLFQAIPQRRRDSGQDKPKVLGLGKIDIRASTISSKDQGTPPSLQRLSTYAMMAPVSQKMSEFDRYQLVVPYFLDEGINALTQQIYLLQLHNIISDSKPQLLKDRITQLRYLFKAVGAPEKSLSENGKKTNEQSRTKLEDDVFENAQGTINVGGQVRLAAKRDELFAVSKLLILNDTPKEGLVCLQKYADLKKKSETEGKLSSVEQGRFDFYNALINDINNNIYEQASKNQKYRNAIINSLNTQLAAVEKGYANFANRCKATVTAQKAGGEESFWLEPFIAFRSFHHDVQAMMNAEETNLTDKLKTSLLKMYNDQDDKAIMGIPAELAGKFSAYFSACLAQIKPIEEVNKFAGMLDLMRVEMGYLSEAIHDVVKLCYLDYHQHVISKDKVINNEKRDALFAIYKKLEELLDASKEIKSVYDIIKNVRVKIALENNKPRPFFVCCLKTETDYTDCLMATLQRFGNYMSTLEHMSEASHATAVAGKSDELEMANQRPSITDEQYAKVRALEASRPSLITLSSRA